MDKNKSKMDRNKEKADKNIEIFILTGKTKNYQEIMRIMLMINFQGATQI